MRVVLGFDDETSTDHDWKPRVLLFLRAEDQLRHGADLDDAVRRELPSNFRDRPVDHAIHTVRAYFLDQLAVDIDGEIEAFHQEAESHQVRHEPRTVSEMVRHGLRPAEVLP